MAKPWTRRFHNVVIMGMPGVGKTTFAKSYAHHSGRIFLDLDQLVQQEAGMPIGQLIAEKGERVFRSLELDCLENACREKMPYVLALGGGTVQSVEVLAFLREQGLLVALHGPVAWLAARLWAHHTQAEDNKLLESALKLRPLLQHAADVQQLEHILQQLLDVRQPFFSKADVVLSVHNSSVDNLKMQLALVEQRSACKVYMDAVSEILNNTHSTPVEQW